MRRCHGTIVLLAALLAAEGPDARAEGKPAEETASRRVNLRGAGTPLADPATPLALSSLEARYRYEIAGFKRLLTVERQLRRCIEARHRAFGEPHDTIELVIEPGGKLTRMSVGSNKRLHVCLTPVLQDLVFPPFAGAVSYTLQVLVGSPGAATDPPRQAAPRVYPIQTKAERRRYNHAVFWVFSPWSMALSRCAEWVDQTMGLGYRVRLATSIDPRGRPVTVEVQVQGQRASAAVDRLVPCVTTFLRRMRVPPHAGPAPFVFQHGTTTTRWGVGPLPRSRTK